MGGKGKGEIEPQEGSTEEELIDEVTQVFIDHKLDYRHDVVVGSTSTDFFVVAPRGSTAVFELKTWRPTAQNQLRAGHLASLYKKMAGVDSAYVVMPGLFSSNPDAGIVSSEELGEFVNKEVVQAPKTRKRKLPKVEPKPSEHVFAAMPFAPQYDDTFEVAMKPATLELETDCLRVDHEYFSGDIVVEMKRLIKSSIAVIADLSESRPNVLYELGFAEALGKPSVQICSTDLKQLPFDVRNNNTLKYTMGQCSRLRRRLVKALEAVLP
jgi:hypothetical protein